MEQRQTKGLEIGEKYLQISVLNGQIKLTAFPNKNKTKPTQPDFIGNGVVVWVSKKRAPESKVEEVRMAYNQL